MYHFVQLLGCHVYCKGKGVVADHVYMHTTYAVNFIVTKLPFDSRVRLIVVRSAI